mgnify:CR=1 FL=1
MKERGYGRIINITSSAGLRGNFGQTNYGAAKAAIMGMTFIWAIELGRYGITVNAMSPAGATRMTEALFARTGEAPPPEANPATPRSPRVDSVRRVRSRSAASEPTERLHQRCAREKSRMRSQIFCVVCSGGMTFQNSAFGSSSRR